MFSKIILFILLLRTAKCSLVIDSLSQKGLYVSDYCPKMKYCAEGAHVMCMYYNPNQLMGPRCSNPKNISITPDLATKLLDVSNAVRSKIALGKEKGKGGEYLPRGYGIFRLKWDNELATLAQVLANQCVLRHDMCRATKRFSDPGQTAGLVRFSYPDWYPVSKAGHFTTPGLNVPKLIYATTQALKSWYGQKNSVTTDMITSYPDWTENPNNQGGRLYLEMIYGPATHMGCGISAYTEYAYYDNNAALNYNSVQIICNYSSRPRKKGIVYNTTAPFTPDFTARCGCPLGSVEDDDCLCHEDVKTHPTPLMQPVRKCFNGSCEPTVVLLPIFTVEDAPPDKLLAVTRNNDTLTRRQDSLEFTDIFDEPERLELTHAVHPDLVKSKKYPSFPTSRLVKTNSLALISKKRILDVKNRYFDQAPHVTLSRYQRTPSLGHLNHAPQKKQSIFTRQAKFVLPTNHGNRSSSHSYKSAARTSSILKKDVLPRKDFSNAHILVDNYLEKYKYHDQFRINSQENIHKRKLDEVVLPNHEINHHNIHEEATETFLHTAEDKVINFNQYLKKQNSTSSTIGTETEDSDRRLMVLLDNLEKEVRNIELHGNEKKMFDAKIRKIYGKVLGKPDNLLETKERNLNKDNIYDYEETKTGVQRNSHIFNNYNKNKIINDRKVKNGLQEIHNFNDETYDKYTDLEYNRKPLSRNQNGLTDDEIQNYYSNDLYNRPKMLSSYEDLTSYGRYNDDVKIRNTYKSDFEGRYNKNNFNDIPKRSVKKQRTWDTHDDPLSAERRKYYQHKLENMERKLQNTRSYKRRNELHNNKQVRRMRPTDDYHKRGSSSKNQIESFYMPERARFLHSFR